MPSEPCEQKSADEQRMANEELKEYPVVHPFDLLMENRRELF